MRQDHFTRCVHANPLSMDQEEKIMQYVKCYKILIKHREFLAEKIREEYFYGYSEGVRHAVLLLLTTLEKRGYIPGGIFLKDPFVSNEITSQSTKFPKKMLEELIIVMNTYNQTYSTLIRIAMDYLIEWMEGDITSEQENYLPITDKIIAYLESGDK